MLPLILAALGGNFATGAITAHRQKKQRAEEFKQNMLARMAPEMLSQGINPFDDTDFTKSVKGTPVESLAPVFEIIASATRKQPQYQAKQALTMNQTPGGTFQVPTDEAQLPAGQTPQTVTLPARRSAATPEEIASRAKANPVMAAIAGFGDVARLGMEQERFDESKRQFETVEKRQARSQEIAEAREERMAKQWEAQYALSVSQFAESKRHNRASEGLAAANAAANRALAQEQHARQLNSAVTTMVSNGEITAEQVPAMQSFLNGKSAKLPEGFGAGSEAKRHAVAYKELMMNADKINDDRRKIVESVQRSLLDEEDLRIPIEGASGFIAQANRMQIDKVNREIQLLTQMKASPEIIKDAQQKAWNDLDVVAEIGGKQAVLKAAHAVALEREGKAKILSAHPSSLLIGGAKMDGSAPTSEEAKGAFLQSLQQPAEPVTLADPKADSRKLRLSQKEAPAMLGKGATPEQIQQYIDLKMQGLSAKEAAQRVKGAQ